MIEILTNELLPDGYRHVRVMSDAPLTEAWMLGYAPAPVRGFAQVTLTPTAALNLFYGDVRYPCREVVRCQVSCVSFRMLAVWKLLPGDRVSEVIEHVAEWYFASAGQRPQFGWMRKLPAGAECGMEIAGVMLLEAEWALDGCVMVGG